jgi:class 3 adenylate cyclase/predicted ATPase/energy-coupling factor transporter ATP-binding protein EcfA2
VLPFVEYPQAGVIKVNCPICLTSNPVSAKFCMECGTSLTTTPQQETAEVDQVSNTERRHVSVMFCDLVGSTALSEQLDPEDLREMILAYREVCAEEIHRQSGQIAQSFGDGLMVYFGYPIAYEDNSQRAIRTGLNIVAQMEQLSTRLMQELGVKLQVRIGIHTGKAVIGETGRGDTYELMDIVGDTPNIASRIQGIATPNTVAISAATHHIAQGYFECKALGKHSLKGIQQPMAVYAVQSEKLRHNRLEAATSGLTPYVGRKTELASLLQRWEQAKSSKGQVVLLTGEAGMGKSRLVQVFQEQIAAESYILRELYCSPYYINSAFYPLIEMLRGRLVQLCRGDSPTQQLAKLERFLGEYELDMAQVVPLFAALLSIELDGCYAPLTISPQAQKQKLEQVFLMMMLSLVQEKPCLIVVEDLHWVDPSTLELLSLLIDLAPTHRLLLVYTARPVFKSAWTNHQHLSKINLTALPSQQTELMIHQITGGKSLPKEVIELVVTKSDRIPLFLEEMTKMVLESGWLIQGDQSYELAGQIPELAIPATLQDLLMARLDRLDTVKEVAQIGATIGRVFSYELLRAVSPRSEAMLNSGLEQLVQAQLVFMIGEGQYLFKHVLIQEAAYESLLKSTRKRYHQQIALVLEQQFPAKVAREPELLAYHYQRADLNEPAIHYWHLAAKKAQQASANLEAINHLTTALKLLETLPDHQSRRRQELDLQLSLSVVLRITKGFGTAEFEAACKRSEELGLLLGETALLFWVRRGLWVFYAARVQHQKALEVGHQLLSSALLSNDSNLLVDAHFTAGLTLFYQGELVSAGEHLESAIAFYNPDHYRSQIVLSGQDGGVSARAVVPLQLWLSGFPEQALERLQEAQALAIELSHPFTLAFTIIIGALLHKSRREWQAVQKSTAAGMIITSEQGFTYLLSWGTILNGWALAASGQVESGILQMRQGLDIYSTTGSEINLPYFLSLLAEAYLQIEEVDVGVDILSEGLQIIEATGERYWEAELYRLKGELLRVQLKHTLAEECFCQALAISRFQGAKSLELRAAMSLARLWQHQGKAEAARQLLAEIYGWFTEGFDTKDLQDALVLLN